MYANLSMNKIHVIRLFSHILFINHYDIYLMEFVIAIIFAYLKKNNI